ncbi:snRNA-activating protein complex subunit 4 [Nerophis lumbriciformis]|uniref:snRNA-activating protein complex subunit 4 n=1 Tax=Nerophis lumbriciformis TaxID=546530 RepID=UPI003BAC636F
MSLLEQRDRIQQEIEDLERNLGANNSELDLLSTDSDEESNVDTDEEVGQVAADLLAERDKVQSEIQNLENVLGPHSPISVSVDDDDDNSSSSSDSEVGLSMSVESCLQMNLVYQQVLQEKLQQLETLMTYNLKQQKEVLSALGAPVTEEPAPSSYPKHTQPLFLGHFLKPYFKDKVTGLGPPANQESKEKMSKMKGCLDNNKMKVRRWEGWQKTLLIDSVSRDCLRRHIQPKLSSVDYLTQKLSSADESSKDQIRANIESLEKEIEAIRAKKKETLIGDQFEDHDWQKIANVDFEGQREADDVRLFWQNFLHPAVNKSRWSAEEVQKLKEISGRHQERHWDLIAKELGTGRTAFMCLQTFQRFISDSLKRKKWTESEDERFRELVHKMRIGNFIPYTQISYFMEGRDTPQLIYRWSQVLDPSLKKGTWCLEEDEMLLRAVKRHGEKNWWKIRLEVPGRTDGACRDRYLDCLKEGTKKGAFDDDEQELLMKLVDKHGVGRWAKIAAEIPNRNDAQCLREWKKTMRHLRAPHLQERKQNVSKRSKTTKVNQKIRKRLLNIKLEETSEDEDEEEEEEEEEEGEVEYMDSDDVDAGKVKLKDTVKVSVEEEKKKKKKKQVNFCLLPMHEWIPEEKNHLLSGLLVVTLQSSSDSSHHHTPVRSTIVGRFGRSVVVGPPPRELRLEERQSSDVMLMMSLGQLRSRLSKMALRFKKLRRVTDTSLDYQLQAAVSPWIGNVLLPGEPVTTLADALRECRTETMVSSTPVFLLLLHAMNVDTAGCRDVIERRKDNLVPVAPPPQPPMGSRNPKTVAGKLQLLWAAKQPPPDVKPPPTVLLQQAPPTHPTFPSIHLVASVAPPSSSPSIPFSIQLYASPPHPPSHQACPSLAAPPVAPPPTATMQALELSVNHDHASIVKSRQPAPKAASTRVGGASTPVIQDGKRVRKLSQKAIQSQALANGRKRKGGAMPPPTKVQVLSSWTPSEQVQLGQAPPPNLVLIGPSGPQPVPIWPRPPGLILQPVGGSSPFISPRPPNGSLPLIRPRPPGGSFPLIRPRPPGNSSLLNSPRPPGSSSPLISLMPQGGAFPLICPQLPGSSSPLNPPRLPGNPSPLISPMPQGGAFPLICPGLPGSSSPLNPPRPPGSSSPLIYPRPQGGAFPLICPSLPGSSSPLNPPRLPGNPSPLISPMPQGGAFPLICSQLPGSSSPLNPPRPPGSSSPLISPRPQGGAFPLICPRLPGSSSPLTSPRPSGGSSPLTCPPAQNVGLPAGTQVLNLDPSLIFPESKAEVYDWLSGQGGVAVPELGVALPYLPPFVSNLSTLSVLLRAKAALTKTARKLLKRAPHAQRRSKSQATPPQLPGATDSSVNADEEAELMLAIRQLVKERFGGNPAYRMLRARFLSCFTLPAVLAAVQPVATATPSHVASEDEEEQDEEEVMKAVNRSRSVKVSVTSSQDQAGPPANHVSGVTATGPA